MAAGPMSEVLQHLCKAVLPQDGAGLTDGQLLQDYLSRRDESALAALVRRHGPMVWGVCRRILPQPHDAEDAFQATFLVLVRRAASITRAELVANWLYGVAFQTARKARATAARRKMRERQVAEMPEGETPPPDLWNDLQPLLDQELNRLPDKYRVPLVLCDLEGKTRREAARQLGCPEGTVAGRLARAREMLARRLARHGIAVSGTALAALFARDLASAGTPPALISATIKAAGIFAAGQVVTGAALSSRAVSLAQGVLHNLLVSKLKLPMVALLVLASLGAGALVFSRQKPAELPRTDHQRLVDRQDAQPPAEIKLKAAEVREPRGDWPQWRGPNRDGIARGVAFPQKWPRALKEEWIVPAGKGAASPVVAAGKVYVFTRERDDEFVLCVDLDRGKEIWRSEPYPAPYKVGPGEGSADDRPRSTPAVAQGRVYTLGMSGVLSCLDADTGKRFWRRDTGSSYYGGSSPLVADGLCIAHVGDGVKAGGLMAFDVRTGEVKWCFDDGYGAMSGSPILVDLAGERQLITYSAWNAAGVSAATGKKLWGVGPGGGGMPCTTPTCYKDLILLADNQDSLRALRLERGGKGITAREVWKARDLPLYYSSPVVVGDLVFGMSSRNGGCYFCLDATSGKTLWESEGRQGAYASIVSAGNVLLFLVDRGRLLVVKATGTAFEPLADYHVSDTQTEAHPVFLGDRILIKDATSLRSFRIEPDAGQP